MKIEVKGDYVRRRRDAYPTTGDQLDALWKAVNELLGNRRLQDSQAQAVREQIAEIKLRLAPRRRE